MKWTPAEYRALVRGDLRAFTERCFYHLNPATTFLENWHLEVICAELEACRRGETTRLILTLPPRSLKSLCASVAFPAFILGRIAMAAAGGSAPAVHSHKTRLANGQRFGRRSRVF